MAPGSASNLGTHPLVVSVYVVDHLSSSLRPNPIIKITSKGDKPYSKTVKTS